MRRAWFAMGVAVVVAFLLYVVYPRPSHQAVVRLYAGAGLRPAVEKLVAAFESKSGVEVEPDYGGSGLILSRARDDRRADLFMPGDGWYVDRLQELTGRVAERAVVAYFVPVIIVARENPKAVQGVGDLVRADLRLGLGKAVACQIGRVSDMILENAGVDRAAIRPQESLTVNELGVWVKMNAVDVAIVWDAIAASIADGVDTIAIPTEQNVVSAVVLARLANSPQPAAAAQFLEFVRGPEGQRILRETGYRVSPLLSLAPVPPG